MPLHLETCSDGTYINAVRAFNDSLFTFPFRMTLVRRAWLVALIVLSARIAVAQVLASGSHTVTVQVPQVTALQIMTRTLTMTVSAINTQAGQDEMTVTDRTTQLVWGINSSGKKITASTSVATPLFKLKLVALNPTRGTPAPEMTVNTTPSDLLLNVGRSTGSCILSYTGIALASQGAGTDAHVITFTVLNQ